MTIIFLGDVVGQYGCELLSKRLRGIRKHYNADVVIANAENSAEGNGVLPSSAASLFDIGINVLTGGNHSLRRREIFPVLESENGLLRPANFHRSAPGSGCFILDMVKCKLCVINIIGAAFLDPVQNPFDCADELLKLVDTPNILVDFHAESTAEKQCMGYYLDGRVSAVVGTHTHVQTADEKILSGGTAYITDVGMCGSGNSVLGVRSELAIERMRTGLPVRFENARDGGMINGVLIELNETTGRAIGIERISLQVDL